MAASTYDNNNNNKRWIRGVNLGGWLVLERYITPYQFAITDCHVAGDFCWYPGQVSANVTDPTYKTCNNHERNCQPLRIENAYGNFDYPVDEFTLAQAFREHNNNETAIAEKWFNHHFANFVTFDDLRQLKESGITHLRVPLPHWIMGIRLEEEKPWIVGDRWKHFVKVCKWARQLGLYVWPDVHTAPGSQNGFDNSGHALPYTTCQVWGNNPTYVERSLTSIREIVQGVVAAEIDDVVTGIGLLNEPFGDCDKSLYHDFIQKGLTIVRDTLGQDTGIYVSDMFQETLFNDGSWWLDPTKYKNTFLDSHYYQVFEETTRDLSPRQHIAFSCENHFRRATSCCYQDGPDNNTMPSQGVSRMVGEWSASFDILPSARITDIMDGIAKNGFASFFDRQLSQERQKFLRQFIEAQIVTFEAEDVGTAGAWFYWTFKMEGGAFAEWDFLRGHREGWWPKVLPPTTPSQDEYGNCTDILFRTNDNKTAVVEEYPKPEASTDESFTVIDDDVVLSHGESLVDPSWKPPTTPPSARPAINAHFSFDFCQEHWLLVGMVLAAVTIGARSFWKKHHRRSKYSQLGSADLIEV